LNSVTGQAWPSQTTLAARLGFDLKTVKKSLKSLGDKYFEINRNCGAVNFYTPIWRAEAVESANVASKAGRAGGENGLGTGGENGPGEGGKNGLLSPSRNPSIIPARVQADDAASGRGDARGIRGRKTETLKGERDDGAIELKAIQLFDATGLDGFNIVSSLHEIDGGLPRLRLFRLIRGGAVTPNDLSTAALVVREYESRKTRPVPINAKRTQNGEA
jgi:hypothetical protein